MVINRIQLEKTEKIFDIAFPICKSVEVSDPLYQHGLTLIPAWISNYTHYNVWDEITYPFLNFNGATAEV